MSKESTNNLEATLSRQEFELFRKFVYDEAGINLSDHKMPLVQGRLAKRLRELKLATYKDYYDHLLQNKDSELVVFFSAISTNVTQFFRESAQWAILEDHLGKILAVKRDKTLRIWSAACSSGEEPYSIVMFLGEFLKNFDSWDVKILATDISKKVLEVATKGTYTQKQVESIPRHLLVKYFDKSKEGQATLYTAKSAIRDRIMFRMFNLVYGDFSIFSKKFDLIFCRNVMIYFDNQTRSALITRIHRLLDDNGLFFMGHSESLQKRDEFLLINSSVYKKTTSRIV